MRPGFCLLFLVLFAASAATATPELISWRQNDIANIIGWRLYVQHDGDPLASSTWTAPAPSEVATGKSS